MMATISTGLVDLICDDLRRLSALIAHFGLAEETRGLFGGRHGYGPEFYENALFLFKSYCWCGRQDCPWCAQCECPQEAFHYFIDGVEVTFDEWLAFFDREAGIAPVGNAVAFAEWEKRADAVNARRSERHDPMCEFCRHGIGLSVGAEPSKNAPNFWFKPSNFKVWWYKWIGRDMEVSRSISVQEWNRIFRKCLDSVIDAMDTKLANVKERKGNYKK